MADNLDDILPPASLAAMARAYATVLEAVERAGVHGLDSVALERVREEIAVEKHIFLAMLSQFCQGGLIGTDDQTKFFSTPHTARFAQVFRSRQATLEVKKASGLPRLT